MAELADCRSLRTTLLDSKKAFMKESCDSELRRSLSSLELIWELLLLLLLLLLLFLILLFADIIAWLNKSELGMEGCCEELIGFMYLLVLKSGSVDIIS